jgi:hypothetical protein
VDLHRADIQIKKGLPGWKPSISVRYEIRTLAFGACRYGRTNVVRSFR